MATPRKEERKSRTSSTRSLREEKKVSWVLGYRRFLLLYSKRNDLDRKTHHFPYLGVGFFCIIILLIFGAKDNSNPIRLNCYSVISQKNLFLQKQSSKPHFAD